jgi:hypothetical protein
MNDEQSREENRVDAPISPADSPDAPAGPTTGEQLEKEHGTAQHQRPPNASPDSESPGVTTPDGPNLNDPNGTENQERPQEVVEAEQEGATDLDDRLGNETGEDDEE